MSHCMRVFVWHVLRFIDLAITLRKISTGFVVTNFIWCTNLYIQIYVDGQMDEQIRLGYQQFLQCGDRGGNVLFLTLCVCWFMMWASDKLKKVWTIILHSNKHQTKIETVSISLIQSKEEIDACVA